MTLPALVARRVSLFKDSKAQRIPVLSCFHCSMAMSCACGLWQMVADARRRAAVQLTCLGGAILMLGPSPVASLSSKYRTISVAGDGNCLFRSVALSEMMSIGKSQPPKTVEDARSKELRAKAVAELIKQRKEIEWAIEGDFNSYVRRMSRNGQWGGEPELFMLSKARNWEDGPKMVDFILSSEILCIYLKTFPWQEFGYIYSE